MLFRSRVEHEAGAETAAQVQRAFQLAFVRTPSAPEAKSATELVRTESLFALCRMLLNANEFVYLD